MQTRLALHLEHYKLLSDSMTGLRRGMPTIHSILDLVFSVEQENSASKVNVVAFLDICIAYDQLEHDPILHALPTIGKLL